MLIWLVHLQRNKRNVISIILFESFLTYSSTKLFIIPVALLKHDMFWKTGLDDAFFACPYVNINHINYQYYTSDTKAADVYNSITIINIGISILAKLTLYTYT